MKRLAVAVTALLLLALAGSALATGTLSGKYKTVIKNDTDLGGALNGTWVVKVKSGHYQASLNGTLIVKGKDTIKGSKITLKDTGGPGKCSGTGKYKFKLSNGGKKVTFSLISDPVAACVGRKDVLTHGSFKKI